MNDDPKKGTGRTTHMLKHAREVQKTCKQVIVMGVNNTHARQLFTDLGDDTNEEGYPKILVVTFREVICGNWYHPGKGWTHYDYATNTFQKTGESVCLVDHAALQHHLSDVIDYLKVTDPISDTQRWLIDCARDCVDGPQGLSRI